MIKKLVKAISEIPSVQSKLETVKEIFEDVSGIKELKEQAEQLKNNMSAANITPQSQHLREKEEATMRNEPWVAVLDTKFNPGNVKHGFFELDWNDQFIQYLIDAGYGTPHDPQEEIVDRWFRDIAYQMLAEGGQDPDRHGAGLLHMPTQGNE